MGPMFSPGSILLTSRTSSEQNKFCQESHPPLATEREQERLAGEEARRRSRIHTAEFLPTSIRAEEGRGVGAWNPSQIHVEFTIPSGGDDRNSPTEVVKRWRHRWSMPPDPRRRPPTVPATTSPASPSTANAAADPSTATAPAADPSTSTALPTSPSPATARRCFPQPGCGGGGERRVVRR